MRSSNDPISLPTWQSELSLLPTWQSLRSTIDLFPFPTWQLESPLLSLLAVLRSLTDLFSSSSLSSSSFWLTDVNHFLCFTEGFNLPQPFPQQLGSLASGQQFLNDAILISSSEAIHTSNVLNSCCIFNASLSISSLISLSSLSISTLFLYWLSLFCCYTCNTYSGLNWAAWKEYLNPSNDQNTFLTSSISSPC
jgi:hypothetical protein